MPAGASGTDLGIPGSFALPGAFPHGEISGAVLVIFIHVDAGPIEVPLPEGFLRAAS